MSYNYQPGESISHGTLRPADLIPAFLAALPPEDPTRQVAETALRNSAASAWEDYVKTESFESMAGLLVDLFDALDARAPAGAYFGSHPGDGSDFGFWPAEEE